MGNKKIKKCYFICERQEKYIPLFAKWVFMIIEFDKEYLLELYEQGKTSDKKHRFQPKVVRAYRKTILILMAVKNLTDLFAFNGLNYEVLDGDKKEISSVRIDKKYRLEFTTREEKGEQLLTICTLIDISNHYKK